MPDDLILYVSPMRHRARVIERELNYAIEERDRVAGEVASMTALTFRLLRQYQVPKWAHSVHVERVGLFQQAVVASEEAP